LFPVDVTLSPAQKVLFETMKDTLTSVGFEFRADDGGKALLCGIPAGAEGLDPENLLRSIIEEAAEGNETATNAVAERISLSLARRAAIPEGQHLTHDEMAGLMQQLFAGTQPKLTPDGKPVLVILPDDRIERYFD
ncbi:MAG: DNA mismatch repair protein MutL, partial [Bacteroidaceae bacterium]|nr:DNA mismatch repair protein MutL [Bacteroidaceae bacterium]